ncbi:hypothetical protein [Streptomyces sp. 3N207]|uniref:hypothetical protein n=1 Tax=Streptomyces sp. 3N207 TaxID=3457417 RepID=UPI003FD27300
MWSSVIAVLGTLAGAALGVVSQHWLDRRTREEQQLLHVTDLVAHLLDAVLAYRELFWLRIAGLREGEPETGEERAALYRARSEITKARDRLALATSDSYLLSGAHRASLSALELSDIELGPVGHGGKFSEAVEHALATGREQTRIAHTELREAGAWYVLRRRSAWRPLWSRPTRRDRRAAARQ